MSGCGRGEREVPAASRRRSCVGTRFSHVLSEASGRSGQRTPIRARVPARLTEETTLPASGSRGPPATLPPRARSGSLLFLRNQEAGLFAVRPLGAGGGARFRRPLSAAHPPEVSVLWRKLMFSGNSRLERSVAGRDDSGDSGFQQPREAAAGPLLPALRECGPASSRPSGAPRPLPPDP